MYSTSVYYYIPRQDVVLYTGTSPRSYQTVYSKNLKLHKGVDNRIQFRFINQEQKPVDVSSAVSNSNQITFRLMDYQANAILLETALTPIGLNLTGILELQLTANQLDEFDAQKCYYSLEIPVNSFNQPVFTDSSSGARGVIEICNSVLPAHMPSTTVTIPSHPIPSFNTVTFHSSVYDNTYNPSLTLQTFFTNFMGTVTIQGSTSQDMDFYDIDSVTYGSDSPFTDTDYYTITGFHPFIRLSVIYSQGSLDNIIAR